MINGSNGKLATSSQYYGRCWSWIYKRAAKLSEHFLKKNPQYTIVTEEVYKGFIKQAQAEFSKLYGHKVRKGNTREINVGKLFELGFNKELNRVPLPTEKVYEGVTLDFSVIKNDAYDITVKVEEEPTITNETINIHFEQPRPFLEVHWSEVEENIERSRIESIIYAQYASEMLVSS